MRLLRALCPFLFACPADLRTNPLESLGTALPRIAVRRGARHPTRPAARSTGQHASLRAALLIALTAFPALSAERVVGYFSNWGMYDATPYTWREVPYSKLTHINYAFFAPGSQGAIRSSDAWADRQQLDPLVDSAHQAGVRVLASIGGWTLSDSFPALAASETARKAFAANARRLVEQHDFDGIDLDWEFPGFVDHRGTSRDSGNLVLLLQTLRDTLDAMGGGMLLTMAVPASPYHGKNFPVARIAPLLDWLGLMTYDMTGPWDPAGSLTWHNSPLFSDGRADNWSTSQSVAYWSGRGLPRDKLLIGLAFYGRTFAGATGPNTPFTAAGSNDGYAPYRDIAARLADGTCVAHFDSVAQAPWCLSSTPSEYVTYDDPASIARKTRYLRDERLGGAILWELKEDRLADGRQPLLDTLDAILHSSPSRIRAQVGRTPSMLVARRTASGWEIRFTDNQTRRIDILAADGRRVWSTTASTATWNGRDATGQRLSTAIHFAHVPATGHALVLPPAD